ncbi:MAG: 1,4-dihydroxy-2-naphthoate octaprenyltransferase [Flavobacteriaceae bacterium]
MSLKLNEWVLAARLKTIPLSISGIAIGSFSAYYEDFFNIKIFILTVCTTISYQILSNLANDFGDGIRGTDLKRVGPSRAFQTGKINPNEMKKGIVIFALLSLSLTICLVFLAFRQNTYYILLFLTTGIAAIAAAIKYTMGKNPYGYYGMGDFFVFIFFGVVSVIGSNFLYTKSIDLKLFFPAISVGLMSVGVLNLNNIRDIENDKKCGKNTIAVKLGLMNSKLYHYLLMINSIICIVIFHFKLENSSYFLLIVNSVIIALISLHCYQVSKAINPKDFNALLKPLVLKTFVYSLLISLFFFKYH